VGCIMVSRIDAPGRRVTSLSALLGSGAVTVRHFYSRSLQDQIDRFLDTNDVDAIYCSSSPMAEYLYRSRHSATRIARARTIMDLIDVDSRKWEQYAEKSPGWNAWIYRREARCLAAYERRIAERFDHVLVVSEQEKALFPGVQRDALLAIPNGVDLDYFTPEYRSHIDTPPMSIVFTGVMDYWPNVEGVGWFVERIFPHIRDAVPDAHLHIVGSRPVSAVRRLGTTAGVTVTGYVDDVRDFIAGARVCVAPLRIARGVQNKVLEAMAMGKASSAPRTHSRGWLPCRPRSRDRGRRGPIRGDGHRSAGRLGQGAAAWAECPPVRRAGILLGRQPATAGCDPVRASGNQRGSRLSSGDGSWKISGFRFTSRIGTASADATSRSDSVSLCRAACCPTLTRRRS